jgi:predicted nucleic acid-binding protein
MAFIFDTSVLVLLAQRDAFGALAPAAEPRYVPDAVDEELAKGAARHPEHHARYVAAKRAGLLHVQELAVGSTAYAEFLRLRAARTSPARNRGEDACVALALTLPGSILYVDDERAANRARDELQDVARVLSSADLLALHRSS